MILFVRLIRLGRIYRPKYDILVYKNYKPIARLGVLHPFRDLNLLKFKVKVLRLNIDLIQFWKTRGLLLPFWLSTIVEPLFVSQKFHGVKLNYRQSHAHELLATTRSLTNKTPFNFINGKTHARFILNSKKKN